MKTKSKKDKNHKQTPDSNDCNCNKDCENCKPFELLAFENDLEKLSLIFSK